MFKRNFKFVSKNFDCKIEIMKNIRDVTKMQQNFTLILPQVVKAIKKLKGKSIIRRPLKFASLSLSLSLSKALLATLN